MNIADSAWHMNIVYWIHIHESIDKLRLPHTVKYILFNEKKRNGIILRMQTFPAAYSNYLLKEIILTFNSVISKYVMSNCWTVISACIVYLCSAVFQF